MIMFVGVFFLTFSLTFTRTGRIVNDLTMINLSKLREIRRKTENYHRGVC